MVLILQLNGRTMVAVGGRCYSLEPHTYGKKRTGFCDNILIIKQILRLTRLGKNLSCLIEIGMKFSKNLLIL